MLDKIKKILMLGQLLKDVLGAPDEVDPFILADSFLGAIQDIWSDIPQDTNKKISITISDEKSEFYIEIETGDSSNPIKSIRAHKK